MQQHAVVAALMVVMKRAMLQGHEADLTAMMRLLCNNIYTVAILEHIKDHQELPSIKSVEQALQGEDRDLLDLLATQCDTAGFQPLEVFTRSVQCGAITASKVAHSVAPSHSPQRAAVYAQHMQLEELYRVFGEYTLPATWGRTTFKLLMRQGVPQRMARLILFLPLLLDKLCVRCFKPSDPWQGGAREYAAMDHLLPGPTCSCASSCHLCIMMYRLAAMVACMTSAIERLILCIVSIVATSLSCLRQMCSQQRALLLNISVCKRAVAMTEFKTNAQRVEVLSGVLDAMLQIPVRDCLYARGIVQLSGPIERVLQGYKARAVASGQTFERVIRLEAAVLGW